MNDYQIRCFYDLDEVSAEWLQLEKQAVLYYFQSFLWLSEWYEKIGRNDKVRPLIIAVYERNRLIALFPFCIERQFKIFRVLTYMGGILADYNAPIYLKGLSDDALREITAEVLRYITKINSIDFILIKNLPEFLDNGHVNPFLKTKEFLAGIEYNDCLTSYYATLSDWEGYYAKISKKIRNDSERQRRRLGKLGKIEFKTAKNLKEVEEITRIMIEQKVGRFREMGVKNMFGDINYQKFYIELGLSAHSEGYLHLSWLDLDGKVIAVHWGILFNGRLYWLMPAFDPEYRIFGPGKLLMENVIEWCCDNKIKCFDFCLGGEGYKTYWADSCVVLHRYTRPLTIKGHIFDIIYRKMRPLAKKLRDRVKLSGVLTAPHYPCNTTGAR